MLEEVIQVTYVAYQRLEGLGFFWSVNYVEFDFSSEARKKLSTLGRHPLFNARATLLYLV